MDWPLAISRNRQALLTIVVALMAAVGLVDGGRLTTLPFHLYRKAYLIIRAAESAVRRLIIIVACDMQLRGVGLAKPTLARASRSTLQRKTGPAAALQNGIAETNVVDERPHHLSLPLVEPLKSFTGDTPDYATFGPSFERASAFAPRQPIPALNLGRRLAALKFALSNLERQARRVLRWQLRQEWARQNNRPRRASLTRPGPPPGYKRKPTHEVHSILRECHNFNHDIRAQLFNFQRKLE